MLGKLFRHEWKDTYATGTICNGIIVVLAIVGAILFNLNIWNEANFESDEVGATMIAMLGSFYFIIMIYGAVALVMVVRYYFFWRYYKNLFTDQGYLMNTLPVRSTDLIKSKLFVGVLWQYITGFVVTIAVGILIVSMCMGVGEMTFIEIVDGFSEVFSEIGQELIEEFDTWSVVLPLIIAYFVIIFVSPFFDMLLMYAAVGVGQLAKKFKFLLSIAVLIGFNMVVGTINMIASVYVNLTTIGIDNSLSSRITGYNVIYCVLAVLMIGGSIGLYFLNKYFLEKKLNLE